MTSSQALGLANRPLSMAPNGLKTANAVLIDKGETTFVKPTPPSSDSVTISAQAANLYKESLAAAPTTTYTVAQALLLPSSSSAISISDTSTNIGKQFARLVAINSKITAITQTDVKAIALTEAQFAQGVASSGLLTKINSGDFKVAISGVSTANLSSVASYGSKVVSMTVGDTSANIASKLADIAALGTKVSAITQTSKSAMAMSYANTLSYATTLDKIDKGSYTLNLTDSASNIKTNLASITKLAAKVAAITQTDASSAIALNTASLTSNLATLKKINSGNFKVSLEDTAALVTKSWTALTAIQKNISSLKLSDATPALTLTASQATTGQTLLDKVSNETLSLTVADTGANISTNLSALMAISAKITKITQTAVGNIAVKQSQLTSEALTSFLSKFNPASYKLAVSGADKTNIVSVLANTNVNAVSLSVDDGTLTSNDAAVNTALQSTKITSISVANAKIANLSALGNDKRVKSIAINDSAANLTNATNLVSIDALMKKTKGIITGINIEGNSRSLVSVAQASYTKYAATVFSAPKNYALEVDFGTPPVNVTQASLRNALKTSANTAGGYGVQVWDFTKAKFGTAITLNKGVNFVKLGTTSTFLDSGDNKLNAILNGGTYKWQQNPDQATAGTSSYELKPGVFSLGSDSANPTISYKFLSSTSDGNLSAGDAKGFAPMSDNQKTAVTKALNYISSLVNINFELSESIGSADINFGTNDQGTTSGGYATGANSSIGTVNLMINKISSVNTNPQVGDYGWQTIVHEIGHTLGLKHPGNYNAGGGGTSGPYLSTTDDNQRNTVMSYYRATDASINWKQNGNSYSNSGVNANTFMPLDILALQFLYGKNTTGKSLSDSSKGLADFQTTKFTSSWLGMQTISSTDEGLNLDLSDVSASNIVDLRAGAFSSINIKDATYNFGIGGKTAQTFFNFNNVGLAYDSSISSLMGGTSSDVVYVSNKNVEIDGNTGTDTVYLAGNSSDWTLTDEANQKIYTNGQVTAKLKNVENVSFYDSNSTTTTHSRIDLTA